tara:strand:- start:583 stop:846 length:264 start_codon:yes stop_codon:yes gene_type:complete
MTILAILSLILLCIGAIIAIIIAGAALGDNEAGIAAMFFLIFLSLAFCAFTDVITVSHTCLPSQTVYIQTAPAEVVEQIKSRQLRQK